MPENNFEKSSELNAPTERQVFSADAELNEALHVLTFRIDTLLKPVGEVLAYRVSEPDVNSFHHRTTQNGTKYGISRSKKPEGMVVYHVSEHSSQDLDGNVVWLDYYWGFGPEPDASYFKTHHSRLHLSSPHPDDIWEPRIFDDEKLNEATKIIAEYERLGNE